MTLLTRRSFFARLGVILAAVPFVGAVKPAEAAPYRLTITNTDPPTGVHMRHSDSSLSRGWIQRSNTFPHNRPVWVEDGREIGLVWETPNPAWATPEMAKSATEARASVDTAEMRSRFALGGSVRVEGNFLVGNMSWSESSDPAAERADQERRAAERDGRPFPNGAPPRHIMESAWP